MILAYVGVALAVLAALAGLTLATLVFSRRHSPRWLVALHPAAAISGLACLWVAFALWRGTRDLPFDGGVLALTFVFAAGAFLFSLRITRLPLPFFAVLLHGGVAILGCALLIAGLVRA
ncbi:MAG: hypothetical protein ACRESR_03630 [Gammaproteobacteria bacterium]